MQQVLTGEPTTPWRKVMAVHVTREQVANLMRLKQDIATGRCSDLTIDYKRLAFARFPYRLGLLHD
jgi:hypothetical protein